jgi:hypothetical protein
LPAGAVLGRVDPKLNSSSHSATSSSAEGSRPNISIKHITHTVRPPTCLKNQDLSPLHHTQILIGHLRTRRLVLLSGLPLFDLNEAHVAEAVPQYQVHLFKGLFATADTLSSHPVLLLAYRIVRVNFTPVFTPLGPPKKRLIYNIEKGESLQPGRREERAASTVKYGMLLLHVLTYKNG